MTEAVVIWHNPTCGTSRNALAMIRAAGIEPTVVEYLKTPPTRDELERGINAAGLSVRAAIRQKDTPYGELGLGDASLTEGKLLDAMLAHPILINRPFVFTSRGVRLCRPSEAVLEILPAPLQDDFVKEDGEVVRPLLTKPDDGLPSLDEASFRPVDLSKLHAPLSTHPPRVLLLYGSLRPVSYSRLLTLEAERLLKRLGCETRVYDPAGLPLPDDGPADHPKVKELRELSLWSEAQVWTSPERHGAMTGVMKSQIDWIPLAVGSVRPTQGRTLAVMQVSGGSQSFNAVNQMRVLGRWMRMLTIPNQSSVAKAFQEFDGSGRMKPSSYYDRVVDVMEELTKFTWATRDLSGYLTDRYSERKESAEALEARVALSRAAS